MSQPHVIRLRGPWTCEPIAGSSPGERASAGSAQPAGAKADGPDWTKLLGAKFRGRVRFTRPFNCPTNIGPDERVRLACDGADARATMALNGELVLELDGSLARSCDITDALKTHNVLVAEVELRPDAEEPHRPADRHGLGGGLLGDVRLEIGPRAIDAASAS
jgi:hypothetical protein